MSKIHREFKDMKHLKIIKLGGTMTMMLILENVAVVYFYAAHVYAMAVAQVAVTEHDEMILNE
jgi:hypothetical protein